MKFAFTAAAALACALPAVAHAEGKPAFSGPYAGVVVGYDHVSVGDSTGRVGKDGFTYGGVLGYDARLSGVVLGLEAEIDGSTTKYSALGATIKAGRDLYVGARIGAPVGPATLLYAKAGYSNARITAEAGGASVSDDLSGFRIGAGVEHAFGPFSARLEYRFTDYSNITLNGTNPGVDAKRHQVVAAAIARF